MSKRCPWNSDLLVAPALEALLIIIVAIAGWLTHKPLIFASLGPTAYELIETPRSPTARPWNIMAGHTLAVVCAFAALALTHAWHVPNVSSGSVAGPRVAAATLAAALTVFSTLVLRANQPAAVSTTLLISTGSMQAPIDAFHILLAVAILLAAGEPLRAWRARAALATAPQT